MPVDQSRAFIEGIDMPKFFDGWYYPRDREVDPRVVSHHGLAIYIKKVS